MGGDLVCVGNALIDIVVLTEDEVALSLGLHPNQTIHIDYPRLAELVAGLPEATFVSGGGAANVAKVASMLGTRTSFQGSLGSTREGQLDQFGTLFAEELRSSGVELHLAGSPKQTGACLVLRMPGDLFAIAASPSAALDFGPDDLDLAAIGKAKLVVLDGFLLPRKELVKPIFDRCEAVGIPLAVDLGSVGLAAAEGPQLLEAARRRETLLFMNEDEGRSLAAAWTWGEESGPRATEDAMAPKAHCEDACIEVFRRLSEEIPALTMVVKRGEQGALAFKLGTILEVTTKPLVAADSTAAGDAFLGGFATALLDGQPLRSCLAAGNAVAGEVLKVPGSTIDGATAGKLRKLIAATKL